MYLEGAILGNPVYAIGLTKSILINQKYLPVIQDSIVHFTEFEQIFETPDSVFILPMDTTFLIPKNTGIRLIKDEKIVPIIN